MISPKIFPNDLSHAKRSTDCNGIIQAVGTAVDSTGLLWVIDDGSEYCLPKLLVFDLMKNEEVCSSPSELSIGCEMSCTLIADSSTPIQYQTTCVDVDKNDSG